jgi:glycosyltransferase involved in cell wall biosynthesis
MTKKKCLFIGHKYHLKTQSSSFFHEILRESYDLTFEYLENFSANSLEGLLNSDADLFVAYQYDFLAPFLLSNGKKVIIVPMYDGTGEMEPAHWGAMVGGLFVNFSSKLHNTHVSLGLNSVYGKYYPDPSNYPTIDLKLFRKNSLFFWERRPSSKICLDWLAYNINNLNLALNKLHVHLAHDPGEYARRNKFEFPLIIPGLNVTTSTWFDSKADFLNTLTECNLYIAPRVAEGIGFSFLDAMACGMIVIAHDYPTMNEYIQDQKNGILFTEHIPSIRGLDLSEISQNARRSVYEGYLEWKKSRAEIINKIEEYLNHPSSLSAGEIKPEISPTQANKMARSFFENQSAYYYIVYKRAVSINNRWRELFRKPFFKNKIDYYLFDSPALKSIFLNFVNTYKRKGK